MKTTDKRERATVAQTPDREDSRLDKLPVWARDEIVNLRRALREAREERDTLMKAPVSNVSVLRMGVEGPREVFLPEGAVVRFYLNPAIAADGTPVKSRRSIDVNVSRAPHRATHLRIGSASGQIAVYPFAANAVNVLEIDDAP